VAERVTERVPARVSVLVPEENLALARKLAPAHIAVFGYELSANGVGARLLRKAGLRNARQHFAQRWRFALDTPLSMVTALWIAPEAQFSPAEADLLLERLPALRPVYWQRSGLDSLPVDQFHARNIRVQNSRGLTSRWVTEAIVACILADVKGLTQSSRGGAPPLTRFTRTLDSTQVAIVGAGLIGRETARLCTALGMRVTGLVRAPELADRGATDFAEMRQSSEDLLRTARDVDYLVLAVPLTNETRGMVNQSVLDALGPRGTLINLARPGLVDQPALLQSLDRRTLGAAFVSRIEGRRLWVEWRARRTRNLYLTHNREAHVEEKVMRAAEQFFAMLSDSESASV